jgi:hypothetical protein
MSSKTFVWGGLMAVISKTCSVGWVGPAEDSNYTPPVGVFIILNASDGTFNNQWFYAADGMQREMLAVALMARSLNRDVAAWVDAPNTSGSPYTAIHNLYMM